MNLNRIALMGIAVNFGVMNEFLSLSFLVLFFVFAPSSCLRGAFLPPIMVKNSHLPTLVNYHWLALHDAWEDGEDCRMWWRGHGSFDPEFLPSSWSTYRWGKHQKSSQRIEARIMFEVNKEEGYASNCAKFVKMGLVSFSRETMVFWHLQEDLFTYYQQGQEYEPRTVWSCGKDGEAVKKERLIRKWGQVISKGERA